jgi:hypothetical protein
MVVSQVFGEPVPVAPRVGQAQWLTFIVADNL